MTLNTNGSIWQDMVGAPSTIRSTPTPSTVSSAEILLKPHAWAINPADAMVQDTALPFITYPLILGEDIAGTVGLVGSTASSKFKFGDRVLTMAPEHGGFQEYVVCDFTMACTIPESLSFAEAAVFPLGITTAAYTLFSKDFLGLPLPKVDPISTGKSILIGGGASAVGSNGIQLSKFAGLEVITTCPARNFDYVRSLGAAKVLDYSSPSVIDDVVAELDGGTCVGICNAAGNVSSAMQVSCRSRRKLSVASATMVPDSAVPEGVKARIVFSTAGIPMFKETNPATFRGFLPEALANGLYKVAPMPEVVAKRGVEGIQEGLDWMKKSVSAKKIVVEAS